MFLTLINFIFIFVYQFDLEKSSQFAQFPMNYKECPIHLYWRNYSNTNAGEINAEQLIKLVESHHANELMLKFDFGSGDFDVDFKPNWNLICEGSKFNKGKLCHFDAYNSNTNEYSTLSACNSKDINGLIRVNGRHLIFGYSGEDFYFLVEKSENCDLINKSNELNSFRKKRQTTGERMPKYYPEYIDGIKRWVELVFIADNTVYKKYESDEKRIHDRLYSIANTINSLYAPLNIRITLIWADIWKEENPIEVTENADKTLRDFLTYRKKFLAEHPHDNAQLLTNVHFGSVIGKAYKGTMCSYDYSGGVIVDHTDNPVFVGMTVAHEMGHNFGMDHDVEQCNCPVDSCIMAAASSNANSTSYFSDCSLDTLSSALRRGVDYCLHNVPKMAFGGAKCGNGVLEDGEDCDCGTGPCPNKCCIASKCKLAKDAECADGDCCDLKYCKLKPLSIVCRDSINQCDLPEYCDGKNPSCPADFFVQDGHKCPDEAVDGYCFQGICGNRKQQCQFIWGPSAENSVPECYVYNEYGSFSGNCGYNPATDQYIRCKPKDVDCGRLQCVHDSDKPVFGDPSTVYSAHNFVKTKAGTEETCRVVKTTLAGTGNRKTDPGMVPDGAKCGKDRICVDATCRNKSEALQMVSRCEPESCNGKGICNNVGNCHCVNDYSGIGCDLPGYGGSVNSGPAHDNIFNPGLALFYLSILLVVIFAVASIYCKRKLGFWIHKKLWSKARVALDLRSFNLVPTRRAPPPPGTQIRHTHRQSWGFNAVWDPAPIQQGEILHVDASRPYIMGGGRAAVVIQSSVTGKNEMPPIIASSKPATADERRKLPAPFRMNNKKAVEEQRALVMGAYDTGKSSSSNESGNPPIQQSSRSKEERPPAIPPHRNKNNKAPCPSLPANQQKPKTAKKPTTLIVQKEGNEEENNSKIDVKALAARFEKK